MFPHTRAENAVKWGMPMIGGAIFFMVIGLLGLVCAVREVEGFSETLPNRETTGKPVGASHRRLDDDDNHESVFNDNWLTNPDHPKYPFIDDDHKSMFDEYSIFDHDNDYEFMSDERIVDCFGNEIIPR